MACIGGGDLACADFHDAQPYGDEHFFCVVFHEDVVDFFQDDLGRAGPPFWQESVPAVPPLLFPAGRCIILLIPHRVEHSQRKNAAVVSLKMLFLNRKKCFFSTGRGHKYE